MVARRSNAILDLIQISKAARATNLTAITVPKLADLQYFWCTTPYYVTIYRTRTMRRYWQTQKSERAGSLAQQQQKVGVYQQEDRSIKRNDCRTEGPLAGVEILVIYCS